MAHDRCAVKPGLTKAGMGVSNGAETDNGGGRAAEVFELYSVSQAR